MIFFIIYALKFGIPGMGMNASVITPDKLKGSMDDLIGMDDIKQEVLHLEDMIRNRAEYKSHNIDKPFNVMLTGPAGTGKTKLVGYLAKKLNVPLIQASGSALESGFVGGGSKALNALYRKACAQAAAASSSSTKRRRCSCRAAAAKRSGKTTPPTPCLACSTASRATRAPA